MDKAKIIRIRPDTHKRLRKLAAELELSLIDTVDKAMDSLALQVKQGISKEEVR